MSTAARSRRLVPLPLPRHCHVSYAGERAQSWKGVNVSDHLTRYWGYMLRVDLERALYMPAKPALDPLYALCPPAPTATRPLQLVKLAARLTHFDRTNSVVEVSSHSTSIAVIDTLVEQLGRKLQSHRRVYELRGTELSASIVPKLSAPFRLPSIQE